MSAVDRLIAELSKPAATDREAAILALASELPETPEAIGQLWVLSEIFSDIDGPALFRTLSYNLARRDLLDHRVMWRSLLACITTPHVHDQSVTVNTAAALAVERPKSDFDPLIAEHLPDFALRAMGLSDVTREAVLNAAEQWVEPLSTSRSHDTLMMVAELMEARASRAPSELVGSAWAHSVKALRNAKATKDTPETAPFSRNEDFNHPTINQLAVAAKAQLTRRLRIRAPVREPTQRLVIAETKSGQLDLDVVSALVDAWNTVVDEVAEFLECEPLGLFARSALGGSFVADLAVTGDAGDAKRVFTAISEAAQSGFKTNPELAATIEPLLVQLQRGHATLQVIQSGDKLPTQILTISEKAGRKLSQAAADLTRGRVPASEIPQADDLARVLRYVELLQEADDVTHEKLGGVTSQRQVLYYRHAAYVLGLVTRSGTLRPAGRQIFRLPPDGRLARVALLLADSVVGESWLEWSEVTSVDNLKAETAGEFLKKRAVGLSPATIKRRARTLEAWLTTLQSPATGS